MRAVRDVLLPSDDPVVHGHRIRSLEGGGMTLAVQIEGRDDAPAVVLLHAIATSSKLWAPQVAPLAADFRVIRVDLPGHGASPLLPGCADYESYADAVVSALADRGIDKFVLVGLSFGAMVAMQIA
ncbi:MAG: alpha/beta fold hydrolase, partial [Lysobacteraceae bacterium]